MRYAWIMRSAKFVLTLLVVSFAFRATAQTKVSEEALRPRAVLPPCAAEQVRNPSTKQCECPPGKIAYRSGNAPAVHCIPAPPCSSEQARNAATGQCECPPGKVAYRSGNDPVVHCVAVAVTTSEAPGAAPKAQ